MATYANTIRTIRRILNDNPVRVKLGAAISDTTTEASTLASGYAAKLFEGQRLEHDDGGETGAEERRVISVDAATPSVTAERGFNGSTAATHSNSTYMLIEPRFFYNKVKQAIDTVLDHDLYYDGIYDITEHQVTSSSTTHAYNAPATTCMKILELYQRINSTDLKTYITHWTDYTNVDTSLWANGKVWEVFGGKQDGTTVIYMNCAHRLAIGTLSTAQERIVQMKACAYLLEWEEPRKLAGPANQSDRTVRPGDNARMAAYYNNEYARMVSNEVAYLRGLTKTGRRWSFH